jgi:hypothetical protein
MTLRQFVTAVLLWNATFGLILLLGSLIQTWPNPPLIVRVLGISLLGMSSIALAFALLLAMTLLRSD